MKAIESTEETTHGGQNLVEDSNEGRNDDESSKNPMNKNEEEKNAGSEEPSTEQDTSGESEKVSKLVAALEKLEQVHQEENEILVETNLISTILELPR